MADKHAYVTSPGQLIEVLDQLKRSFPQNLTAEVLKKLSLASSNEGAVINTIRFLGLIDDQNTRTEKGQKVFTLHSPEEFKPAFADVIRDAYSELFDLHEDSAWTLELAKLVTFFRQADQSTDRVGREQARTFKTLASYAGYDDVAVHSKPRSANRGEKAKSSKKPKSVSISADAEPDNKAGTTQPEHRQQEFGLTVRIEINLPVADDQVVYDRIFRSLRENLLEWPKS